MRFADDPRLDKIIAQAELLKGLQEKIKAMPLPERGPAMLAQAQGYQLLRDLLQHAAPAWQADVPAAMDPVPRSSPPLPREGSFSRRLYEFLRGRAGTAFHYLDLAAQFKDHFGALTPNALRGRLTELKKKGLIEQTGKGLYRYAEPWDRQTLPPPPASGEGAPS